MIWLSWRQFRAQGAIAGAALVAIAVVLAVTGVGLANLADASESGFFRAFTSDGARTTVYYAGYMAVIGVPAIVGVFWGAPLVARELEAGTHRLAWNQTVTRTRWLATKLGFTCLAAMAATGLLSLMVTWWCNPIDAAINDGRGGEGFFGLSRVSPAVFDARGIAPIGYAAFAVVLGVAAGLVIRRTVPAMAVTLAVFVAAQIAMPTLVRPHFGPSEHVTAITAANLEGLNMSGPDGPVRELTVTFDSPGAWKISNETIDAGGRTVDALPSWVTRCVSEPGMERRQAGARACFARLAQLGYEQRLTYQPASRYWTLQAYETAIFIGLALLLTGFCFWWVRRLS